MLSEFVAGSNTVEEKMILTAICKRCSKLEKLGGVYSKFGPWRGSLLSIQSRTSRAASPRARFLDHTR